MVSRDKIEELVKRHAEGSGLFVVDIHVSHSNEIRVLADSETGMSLDDCVRLSRALENSLDREEQDFQLEVSSPGLSEPLKILPQYRKNIGRDIEVITKEGQKHTGRLIRVNDSGLVMEEKIAVRDEKKRHGIKTVENEFDFNLIRSTKVVVSFK